MRSPPDPRLRARTSSNWMQLEDRSSLGCFLRRPVDIDPVDDANERDTERYASGERTKDVAKECNALCRVKLTRSDFFFPAADGDGRAAASAQVAHPLDLAPGTPDPPLAGGRDDRHTCGAREAALPAANRDERLRPQRNGSGQQHLKDRGQKLDVRR